MTHAEWKNAFEGFGGEAGAKLKEMMYADWANDRAALLSLLREAREALHVSQYQGCGVDKELLSRIDAALKETK